MIWPALQLDLPHMLWLLAALLPAVCLLYSVAFRRRRQALALLVEGALAGRLLPATTSERRRWAAAGCIIAAVAAVVAALAQPRWGDSQEDLDAQGRNIVVLLDVSLSMLAEDVQPSRLARAKRAILAMVDAMGGDGNHRLALVTFAGRADLRCPPTRDVALLKDRLDTAGVDDVSQRGSAVGGALLQTLRLIDDLDPAFTDLVLVSDGEDHGGQPIEAARLVAGRGFGLFVVGIGDASRSVPVPTGKLDGDTRPLVHEGSVATTRLRRGVLVGMAEAAGTAYVPLETGEATLAALYRDEIATRPRHAHGDRAEWRPQHRFQLFLLAAVLLLLAEPVLRRVPSAVSTARAVRLRSSFLAGLLASIPFLGGDDPAVTAVRDGNARFAAGDFAAARELYEAAARQLPASAEIAYNIGDSLFRDQEHEQAIEQYMTALGADSEALRARAKYNIGVTRLQQAIDPARPPSEASWQLQAAIRYFRESLALDRDLEDARYNLELARRRLNALQSSQASQRQDETRLDDKATLRRGQALQDLLQEQEAGGEQKSLPDELRQTRADRSNDIPQNFSNKESPKGRNDTPLPIAMSPDAAAEMMERLLEAMSKAEHWRHEQRVGRLPSAGEREPW